MVDDASQPHGSGISLESVENCVDARLRYRRDLTRLVHVGAAGRRRWIRITTAMEACCSRFPKPAYPFLPEETMHLEMASLGFAVCGSMPLFIVLKLWAQNFHQHTGTLRPRIKTSVPHRIFADDFGASSPLPRTPNWTWFKRPRVFLRRDYRLWCSLRTPSPTCWTIEENIFAWASRSLISTFTLAHRGQTTRRCWLRFRQDVIDLHPKVGRDSGWHQWTFEGNHGPLRLEDNRSNFYSSPELARARPHRGCIVLGSSVHKLHAEIKELFPSVPRTRFWN